MIFPLYIARRYLFSKKKHNAINVISVITICGLTLATMAMVVTMSIFNGFRDVVAKSFTHFDPQLKITAAQGKTFHSTDRRLQSVGALPCVDVLAWAVEDNALVKYKDKQTIAVIKGVSDNFGQLTNIEKILFGNSVFMLRDETAEYGTMGIGLVGQLNCGVKFLEPLEVFAPKKGAKINPANPASAFRREFLFSPGSVFTVGQEKYDASYIVTSIGFARKLFGYTDQATSVELKLKPGYDTGQAKQQIQTLLGGEFVVRDRYEQQEDIFKIMNVEKAISFIFLTFILLVATLNIISSLSMLIIDKRDDVATLRNMGASRQGIFRIFLLEGWLISLAGALTGIGIGLALCLAQQHFGWIKMGDGNMFLTPSYPIVVDARDVLLVFFTVAVTSMLTTWIPTKILCRRLLKA